MEPLLEVRDLQVQFTRGGQAVTAVDGVSFHVGAGETVALVGESGCGKSVTARSILRLIRPPGRITGGRIVFKGRDLLSLGEAEMRRIRGNAIAMVFQEPMTSLNPVYTVGRQIVEALRLHRGLTGSRALAEAIDLLRKVQIADPERRVHEYPHQLSGGMRQRVMIAMALACRPQLLIADEPTTALDVTVQAQILELIRQLQAEFGMAVLMITHDLGVVAEVAQRVVVMYAGRVVEEGTVAEIFRRPAHPYTMGLLHSVPRLGQGKGRLQPIPGAVPDPAALPGGCRFHPRCPLADERCRMEPPPLELRSETHRVACWWAGQTTGSGVA
ncbi:ABC transporter ATP-binding protein [Thermaerobacter sp. PB12/4term]|uniref:ABC transporter ATP-binding protein n=1 Tax=Thermaerobacter sp. PB12/4term TaxID=2293838 RepID=UPI000E325B55|nr:ABC transporter ATP-binding protein [Thermaerobacter sp. PB12/4term]QIA27246.1 ABC transporter ATP-binding protein [Thermaerobacter sp. PB12/4term]